MNMGKCTMNYLDVVSKLFDNFYRIVLPNDIVNLFGPECLEDVWSSPIFMDTKLS